MPTMTCRRILIVDDNIDLAENIAEILQIDGHLTEVAASAEDALKTVGLGPDVVVTDYRLPGINGVEFVKRLHLVGLRVCAIVMSAYTDDGTMKAAKDAGATFMAKPVDFRLLSRVVSEAFA
jgi:DNA-binding NtrC family response regulator